MEISISQFRRELFTHVNRALQGAEVWVTHKGRRLKLVPEGRAESRLGRATPLEIVNPGAPGLTDPALKARMMAEMEEAWERDWNQL